MIESKTTLTGITTTGTPHLGNYVGAIRPAIVESRSGEGQHYYFLADYHALIKCQDPETVRQSTLEIAATWLALGLDTQRAVFYRQSDIPEITELAWLLNCVAAKGLLNRAHAYKDAVQKNEEAKQDPDFAITMGLFSYPVLMAADILLFQATHVPVGEDQVPHLELSREVVRRFNNLYGDVLTEPMRERGAAPVDSERCGIIHVQTPTGGSRWPPLPPPPISCVRASRTRRRRPAS